MGDAGRGASVRRRARTVLPQPWLQLVQARAARLDLAPLLAVLPRRGYVPDFLIPPPRTSRPGLRNQLAEIRATEPAQVARELRRCRETVDDEQHRRQLTSLLADPERARDQLAARLHDAWTSLVAPFWVRIRTLLDRDIDARSRTLARHGLRSALDELHPKIRWTKRGLSLADRTGRTVAVSERGFLLMPSAYLWPHVAAIIEEPWQPTIIYPATGIAELWQAPAAPPGTLGRLLGRTRALILAALDQPPLDDRARRGHRTQPSRRLTPPARAPRRRSPHRRPARPRGPLPPDRTRIRASARTPRIARPRPGGKPCRFADGRPRSFKARIG